MRYIRLRMDSRSNFYVRKASEDLSWFEIQNQNSGIIVKNPTIKRTILKGVVLVDQCWAYGLPIADGWLTDRNYRNFEKNEYTRWHYNR